MTSHSSTPRPVSTTGAETDYHSSLAAREPADPISQDAEPDADYKPQKLSELKGKTWRVAFKRAISEFGEDQCTDLAAGLTYFSVLSIFPALVALVSLLGVFGQGQETVDSLIGALEDYAPQSTLDTIRGPIEQLVNARAAGFALIVGILGAIYSASKYVACFGRSMNRIYEVEEGRPFYILKPVMFGITALLLILVAAGVIMLAISGPVAEAIGGAVGLSDTALTVWNWSKIPALLLIAIVAVAVLYRFTPNIKQPSFRWLSPGASLAILTIIVSTAAFAFYVSNFGSYNATYGSLAGVIVFLLWLWITNNVLLLGAEIDSEIERARQLQGGMHADEAIQLPPRGVKGIEKAKEKKLILIEEAAEVRREGWRSRAVEASSQQK